MVDSREKGARAEAALKTLLRKETGLNWQRVPASGGLAAKHGLKGDLYVPNEKNVFCVEVKHYKDDQLTSKILTSKNPIIIDWWEQTIRESSQVNREPLLVFKYDRSKWFACTTIAHADPDFTNTITIDYGKHCFHVVLLEDFLKDKGRKFIE
jgi:Holliday junction resolvase